MDDNALKGIKMQSKWDKVLVFDVIEVCAKSVISEKNHKQNAEYAHMFFMS